MAIVCVAPELESDVFRRPKIQKYSKTRLAEQLKTRCCAAEQGAGRSIYTRSADWRYRTSTLTACHHPFYNKHPSRQCKTSLPQVRSSPSRCTTYLLAPAHSLPTFPLIHTSLHLAANPPQKPSYDHESLLRASALVAVLLQQLKSLPALYGSCPAPEEDLLPLYCNDDTLAEAAVSVDSSAPNTTQSTPVRTSSRSQSGDMDLSIDFGDTSGVQTRGKKAAKKAAKQAQQAKWFESDNEGEGGAEGEGGDDGFGGGGDGSNGAGGGGDDNGGGGGGDDDGDDWAFGGGKKNKKKSKKKQDEEDEQKKKDEEANATGTLNWADDANNAAADDDWAQGFSTKKDKKKKKKASARKT